MSPKTDINIPIDLTHPLTPTRALAIHLPAPAVTLRPSQIQDLTPRLPTLFSASLGITDENLLSAHKASIVSPPPQVRYTLEKQNVLGTHLAILDVEGNEVAGWKHPMLSFGMGSGKTKVQFPDETMVIKKIVEKINSDDSKHHHHHHHYHHAECFEKGGVTYLWEADTEKDHQKALFKVVEFETAGIVKREVARYAQRTAHEKEGLLVLDGREVDELVVVLTICAMLESKDSFLRT